MLKAYLAATSRLTDLKDRLQKDESGASLVEYTVLIGLITVATVGTITIVGDRILELWVALSGAIAA